MPHRILTPNTHSEETLEIAHDLIPPGYDLVTAPHGRPEFWDLLKDSEFYIGAGQYKHGERIPAASLMSEHKVSRQVAYAALAMLAAIPAAAQTSFPDLHGTWRGDSESIISDSGNPHHPGPSQSEPRLTSVPFTLTIDKQDGRRFSGTFSSPRDAESVIGVITRAGNLLFVDTDGYASGTLLGPDRLEARFLQIATYGQVASCTELTRQR